MLLLFAILPVGALGAIKGAVHDLLPDDPKQQGYRDGEQYPGEGHEQEGHYHAEELSKGHPAPPEGEEEGLGIVSENDEEERCSEQNRGGLNGAVAVADVDPNKTGDDGEDVGELFDVDTLWTTEVEFVQWAGWLLWLGVQHWSLSRQRYAAPPT